jgi:cytochrome c oxidase subunit 3/cytochrome o ubiquinol oxidase subunit 3
MLTFLVSEVAFFGTLIMTYVYFLRQPLPPGDPIPSEVFHLPLVLASSVCLLSSSATIHLAEKALHRSAWRRFLGWWGLTIALGILFLVGTAREWSDLIGTWGLTISRNLFGTTYFTLVGFHALHVTVGVLVMSIVFGLGLRRQITERNRAVVEVVSWYWHFVDGVWIVVFTLVYIIGR